MRKIDLFIILLIVGLYLLTSEKNFFQSSVRKSPPQVEHKVDSLFNDGLPEDLAKTNINSYTTREKLMDDLNFREMKLLTIIKEEQHEFQNSPDVNDPEKYSELLNKHKKAQAEFQKTRQNLLDEYEVIFKEQESSRSKGLR